MSLVVAERGRYCDKKETKIRKKIKENTKHLVCAIKGVHTVAKAVAWVEVVVVKCLEGGAQCSEGLFIGIETCRVDRVQAAAAKRCLASPCVGLRAGGIDWACTLCAVVWAYMFYAHLGEVDRDEEVAGFKAGDELELAAYGF